MRLKVRGTGGVPGMCLLLALLSLPALGAPRVMLTPYGAREAGELKDGELLARGRIEGADGDIRVWIRDAQHDGALSPGHYVLSGAAKPEHRLRVRLEVDTDGASPDAQGIRVPATGRPVGVNIVADGRQRITADRYALDLRVAEAAGMK